MSPPGTSSSEQDPPQVSKQTERENTSHPSAIRLSSLLSALLGCRSSTLATSFIPEHSTGTTNGPRGTQADSSEQGSHARPGTAAIQHRSGKNQMLGKEESCPCCCSLKGKPRGAAGKSKKAADGQVPHQGAKINKTSFELLPKS